METLRLSELLVGLSLVADMGMGLEPGESARAALIATRLAEYLDAPDQRAVYYTSLLQHVGCTAYAHEAAALLGGDEIAVKGAAVRTDFTRPREVLLEYLPNLAPGAGALTRLRVAGVAAARSRQITDGYTRANCEVAALTARRVGLGEGVERGLGDIFECWNGKGGPRGIAKDDIALQARLAQVAAVGGLFDRLGMAVEAVSTRAGKALDPAVCAAFTGQAGAILGELREVDVIEAAVDAEPAPAVRVSGPGLDAACRAFGEAVDLKSPFHHGHSTGVAELAAGAAERLGLPDVDGLRRAALLHDIGRAGVPNGIWEKRGRLDSGDWERVRLHAYHSERILSRCGPLAACAPLAGMHHERLDGSGYHRAAVAASMPLEARVLAAADVFVAVTQERAHRPARAPDEAAAEVSADAAAGRLDADAARAVIEAAGERPPRMPRPAGLTDRQVEVLRLLSRGLSNPEIARRLVVSRRTAEHHVQDIYARIGVSSRAAAALYAMEHDLLIDR